MEIITDSVRFGSARQYGQQDVATIDIHNLPAHLLNGVSTTRREGGIGCLLAPTEYTGIPK